MSRATTLLPFCAANDTLLWDLYLYPTSYILSEESGGFNHKFWMKYKKNVAVYLLGEEEKHDIRQIT